MQKEVVLTGLSTTPSDYDSKDGEIAAMLNLVNEHGALKPIHQPKVLAEVPEGCEVYLHKSKTFANYIIITSDNKYYFCDSADIAECYKDGEFTDKVSEIIKLRGNKMLYIKGMGDFLILSTDKQMYYLLFSSKYNFYAVESLYSDYSITITKKRNVPRSDYKDISMEDIEIETSDNEALAYFDYGDGQFTATIKDRDLAHKHIEVGFAALTLYDGTYIQLSDLFLLYSPNRDMYSSSFFLQYKEPKTSGNLYYAALYAAQFSIKVTATIPDAEKLVSGITIFLSTPETFWDFSESSLFPDTSTFTSKWGRGTSKCLNGLDLTEKIDGLSFYKTLFIDTNHFNKDIDIPAVDATNESLSYASLNRTLYNGYINTYNERLHISPNYFGIAKPPTIEYKNLDNTNNSKTVFGFAFNESDCGMVLAQIDVEGAIQNETYSISYQTQLYYPHPPIVVIPIPGAKKVTITSEKGKFVLFNVQTSGSGDHSIGVFDSYKRNVIFSIGLNMYVEGYAYAMVCAAKQYETTELPLADKAVKTFDNPNYQDGSTIVEKDWNLDVTSMLIRTDYGIKVSEAENPFVFPAANTVTCGSGKVLAMCSNTKAMSQGQFGEHPMYVFTTEGVWALQLNSSAGETTYTLSTPVSRDVCINENSITQTDDSILFATDRGIMMITGSETKCVSEILKDGVQKIKLPHIHEMMQLNEIAAESDELSSYIYESDFHDLLKNCYMLYDYKCQRILVFQEDSTYVLVFSLQSAQWGMMECNFVRTTNSYPECYALMQNIVEEETESGTTAYVKHWYLVDNCNNDDQPILAQYIISRPLVLDAPDILKRINSMIVRGNFRKGAVKVALYGSRNLFDWHLVWSSTTHRLRGFSGSPYKYYRVAIMSNLQSDESIERVSIDYDASMSTKLR